MNLGVYIGRFQPIHKGHQKVIDVMIKENDIDNCVILLGSASSYNEERNPFTYIQRKKWISLLYKNLKILPISDVSDSNEIWFEFVKDLINNSFDISKYENIVFYGGSADDCWYIKDLSFNNIKFNLINRESYNISATLVRETMKNILKNNTDIKSLKELLDEKILDLVLEQYSQLTNSL